MAVINLEGVNVIDTALAIPNTDLLTDGLMDGTGVFDILIKTVKLHLMEEYDAGRISGKEYSTVYLGALSAVLQQSIQYIVNHQQTIKTTTEIGLLRQQTATELAKTDDTIPVGLGFNATSAIKGMVAEEKLLNAQKILHAEAQVASEEKNTILISQKIVTELAQTDEDIPVGYGINNSTEVTGLAKAERLKKESEIDLTKQKVLTELAATSDTVITGYAKNTSTTVGGLLKKQVDKAAAEVQLLNQKSVTELAQTDDTIPAGTGISTNTAVTGVVGRQKSLFLSQSDGFSRDAEQKLTKIMLDPLVAQIAGDAGTPIPTGLANTSLDAVLTKAKAGIGVS